MNCHVKAHIKKIKVWIFLYWMETIILLFTADIFVPNLVFLNDTLTFIVETLERRDNYFVIQQKMLNRLLRHWLYAHYQIPKYLVNESKKNSKRWDFSLEKWYFFLIIACISMIQSSIHFLSIFWSIFQKVRFEKNRLVVSCRNLQNHNIFPMQGVIRAPRFLLENIIVTT